MLRYKAGYKFTDYGVHAQVIDFPAAGTVYSAVVGSAVTFRAATTDPDVADRVTYSLEIAPGFDPPVGATIRATTGEFAWATMYWSSSHADR